MYNKSTHCHYSSMHIFITFIISCIMRTQHSFPRILSIINHNIYNSLIEPFIPYNITYFTHAQSSPNLSNHTTSLIKPSITSTITQQTTIPSFSCTINQYESNLLYQPILHSNQFHAQSIHNKLQYLFYITNFNSYFALPHFIHNQHNQNSIFFIQIQYTTPPLHHFYCHVNIYSTHTTSSCFLSFFYVYMHLSIFSSTMPTQQSTS